MVINSHKKKNISDTSEHTGDSMIQVYERVHLKIKPAGGAVGSVTTVRLTLPLAVVLTAFSAKYHPDSTQTVGER